MDGNTIFAVNLERSALSGLWGLKRVSLADAGALFEMGLLIVLCWVIRWLLGDLWGFSLMCVYVWVLGELMWVAVCSVEIRCWVWWVVCNAFVIGLYSFWYLMFSSVCWWSWLFCYSYDCWEGIFRETGSLFVLVRFLGNSCFSSRSNFPVISVGNDWD